MDQIALGSGKPILAGIIQICQKRSVYQSLVPGVNIPQHIIDRLEQADNPLQEGIKIAAEQVQIARQICQGVHMMAVKREDLIAQILDLAGIPPSPS